MGERLGYVVVTFRDAGYQDLANGDVLFDDLTDAEACRDEERERTALGLHPRDRHVLAEVIEMEEREG